MVRVHPSKLEEFANRMSTDRALKAREKTDIKTYVLANCVGMTNEQIIVHLAVPKEIPNPVAQGTISLRTRDDALRKLYRTGVITQAQLIASETDTIPDPSWQPTVIIPAPLDALLGEPNCVISLNELERLMV